MKWTLEGGAWTLFNSDGDAIAIAYRRQSRGDYTWFKPVSKCNFGPWNTLAEAKADATSYYAVSK